MRRSKVWLSGLALSSLIITISSPLQPSLAGDGKSTENFSFQFNAETSFAPQISVPPQNDNYGAYLVLPPCVAQVKNDCISSVEYTNTKGEWIKGKFKELIPLKNVEWSDKDFRSDYNDLDQPVFAKARPAQNYPAGGRTGIWDLSGAPHAAGTTYAVTLGFPGAASNTVNPRAEGSVVSWYARDGFTLKLFPIVYDINAPLYTDKDSKGNLIGGANSCSGGFGSASRYRCVASEIQPFPRQTKFRITANFKATKTMLDKVDWYFGRVINAGIKESKGPDGSISVSFEGSPTLVGSVMTEFAKNQENYEVVKRAYDTYWQLTWGQEQNIFKTYEDFAKYSGAGLSTRDPGTSAAWQILEEKFDFNYLFEEETWQVSTSRISLDDLKLISNCGEADIVPGIISTNAVAANPSPPKWNPETKELTYSIASPHTRKDGALNVGVYELSIDKRLAECLWGKDSLQYRAAISVTTADGTQKVATTLFADNDKVLSFRATGFSYSTSLIRVKLNKDGGSEASKKALPDLFLDTGVKPKPLSWTVSTPKTKTSTTKPTPAKSPLKTITCTKGKISKKVTASNPKCPSGLKRIN